MQLPEDYSTETLPEWRLATFSLIFPLASQAFGADPKSGMFIELDTEKSGFALGRDEGVRSIVSAVEKIVAPVLWLLATTKLQVKEMNTGPTTTKLPTVSKGHSTKLSVQKLFTLNH